MAEYRNVLVNVVDETFPVVETEYGKVTGYTTNGVSVFKGIPYGGRVDRERRFLPAEAPEPWEGVLDCTKNGPIAVQNASSIDDFFGTGGHPERLGLTYETQDENCLVLNVLTPGIDGRKRPVLFYIHGGGYWQLSGTTLTGADRLAREEDVVLVSVNHRLHVFGYLYLGDLDPKYRDSGNVGHLDLILALTWVRDNIAAFGGDPGNVTIMGESGGSDKVLSLTHFPAAQGLFHKAIAVSCFLPSNRITKEIASRYTLEVLRVLGISPEHPEKLLELPARFITEKVFDPSTGLWCMTFAPVADGVNMLPGTGSEGYVSALPSVPLIVGASEDEMAPFDVESSFDITEENFRDKILEKGKDYGLPFTEESADEAAAVFRRTNGKHDTADHLFMKMISIKGFMGGAFYFAEDYAKAGKGPVYLFLNRYDAPHAAYPDRHYAGHCIDISTAFRLVAYPQMEEYSKNIAKRYAAFMRTGSPSLPGSPWPAFNLEERPTMVYDRVFEVKPDPVREERELLDRVAGFHGVVDHYLGKGYKFPIKGKPSPELE